MTSGVDQGQSREAGFSLVEMLVVVVVLGTLMAIAVPTFLSARSRADDRAAQTSLRHALLGAKAMYNDDEGFAAADDSSTGLRTVEPSLTYLARDTSSSGPRVVSVHATATSWSAAVHSVSGSCYWIRQVATAATSYGGDVNHPSSCSADDADGAQDASFP